MSLLNDLKVVKEKLNSKLNQMKELQKLLHMKSQKV